MPGSKTQTTINATPQQVYDYLADLPRHGEWAAHPLVIKLSSDSPVAVGSTFTSEAKMMGAHHATVTLTALEPPTRIAYVAEDDTGRWQHEIRIAQQNGATTLTKSVTMLAGSMKSRIMAMMLVPIVGKKIGRQDGARIKERVEAASKVG